MSLINEYLKKTEKESPLPDRYGDIPPVLKSSRKGGREKSAIRLTVLAVTGVFAGLVFFQLQPYKQFYSSSNAELPVGKVSRPISQPNKTRPVISKTLKTPAVSTDSARLAKSPAPAIPKAVPVASAVSNDTTAKQKPVKHASVIETKPSAQRTLLAKKDVRKDKKELKAQNVRLHPSKRTKTMKRAAKPKMPDVDIEHYYQSGLMAQKEGEYRTAERFYLEGLKRNPSHIDILTNLSAVYIRERRYADAEETLEKIRRIDPRNANALVNLGIINLNLQRYKIAENMFQKALMFKPRDEMILNNLACLALRENNIPLTEKYYKEILEISPDKKEVLLAYASLLEKSNRYTEAMIFYQKSLEIEEIQKDRRLSGQIANRIRLLNYYSQKKTDEKVKSEK